MGLRQEEFTTFAAPAPDAATAAEELPPPPPPEGKGKGKGTKEPDLKKRKKNEEQQPTPPVPDGTTGTSTTTVAAADQHVATDRPAVLSDNHSKDGSSKKRKADRVNADGEEARLLLVHAASDTAVDSNNDLGGSIDKKQEDKSRIIQDMVVGSPRDSAMMMSLLAPPRKKKKLLILDLNGLLADINQDRHNAHLSHGMFRGKLVFKRPYCDDFLRFCIHHFELGIWSSRLRANVDAVVNILMKDLKHHLLFCWDMSKCTGTGLNTLENNAKPLVLKELKKLWDKEEEPGLDLLPWQMGEFSPSNTLLVDDSPYKALRNPPHTAIFPCPYSYKNHKDDDSLGPDGDLRLYLEGLAAADDVQCYVREHPFGQPPITDTDPDWEFYRQILLPDRRGC